MTCSPSPDSSNATRREATPGFAIWLTGLPASGKTTIARALQSSLSRQAIKTEVLDSDELRLILTPEPRYDERERDLFYAAVVRLASHLVTQGLNVLIAATANRRRYREKARQEITRFMEVFIKCPIEICNARDPKGLYQRARQCAVSGLPGIQAEYEPPVNADVVIDSRAMSAQAGAQRIIDALQARGWLRNSAAT